MPHFGPINRPQPLYRLESSGHFLQLHITRRYLRLVSAYPAAASPPPGAARASTDATPSMAMPFAISDVMTRHTTRRDIDTPPSLAIFRARKELRHAEHFACGFGWRFRAVALFLLSQAKRALGRRHAINAVAVDRRPRNFTRGFLGHKSTRRYGFPAGRA